jgi:hypothetical protein
LGCNPQIFTETVKYAGAIKNVMHQMTANTNLFGFHANHQEMWQDDNMQHSSLSEV